MNQEKFTEDNMTKAKAFSEVEKIVARNLALHLKNSHDNKWGFDGGVVQGIELTLSDVYGYEYDYQLDKDISAAAVIKQKAELLVEQWQRIAENLNGEWELAGQRVTIESDFTQDQRIIKYHNGDEYGDKATRKYVDNDVVSNMITAGLLVKYEEPEFQ